MTTDELERPNREPDFIKNEREFFVKEKLQYHIRSDKTFKVKELDSELVWYDDFKEKWVDYQCIQSEAYAKKVWELWSDIVIDNELLS